MPPIRESSILLTVCATAFTGLAVGCALKHSIVDTPIVCRNFQPIEYVDSDSYKTKFQIVTHNAVWDKYCDKKEKE